MLARLRKIQEEREGGFTLIELLVVVIIIGILAAIAIPTFLNQREKAWQKAALSDLRNGAVKMEEAFSDSANGQYSTATAIKKSEGVTSVTPTVSADGKAYCLTAVHSKLSGVNFSLHSADGVAKMGTACPAPVPNP